MELQDIARRLPDEVWAAFAPHLPEPVYAGVGCRPHENRETFHGLLYVLITGIGWEYVPPCFPSGKTIRRRLDDWLRIDAFRTAWRDLAARYEALNRMDQLGPGPPRRLREAVKKGGARTGPSPVDRGKSGTAIHPACGSRAMPLAVTVTAAGANDGCQTHQVRAALVLDPPRPGTPVETPDPRSLPTARADGPSRDRATSQGFRLYAPGRGRKRPGVGKVRNAVERCHNFFAQFGRVARRFDRSARRYLGWCQLAAAIILVRSDFVR